MKSVTLEYGESQVTVRVPEAAKVLSSYRVASLGNPAEEIHRRLREPIGTKPLDRLAEGCTQAAVVVSDNTRPVPYDGPASILAPIIDILKEKKAKRIKIIVAYGTHRILDELELKAILGPSAFQPGVDIINHQATDESMLCHIGHTERIPHVTVNRHYLDSDLKILTGLVEPHFMAGFSGGPKSVCPGICGQSVVHGFHSASMLDAEGSTSLVLEGNPCNEESMRIARMAGVDFIVNVTLDGRKRMR